MCMSANKKLNTGLPKILFKVPVSRPLLSFCQSGAKMPPLSREYPIACGGKAKEHFKSLT